MSSLGQTRSFYPESAVSGLPTITELYEIDHCSPSAPRESSISLNPQPSNTDFRLAPTFRREGSRIELGTRTSSKLAIEVSSRFPEFWLISFFYGGFLFFPNSDSKPRKSRYARAHTLFRQIRKFGSYPVARRGGRRSPQFAGPPVRHACVTRHS